MWATKIHEKSIWTSLDKDLKLVSAILINFFSQIDSPSKTMENVLISSEKLFVLKIFKFLQFFPFLSTFSRF